MDADLRERLRRVRREGATAQAQAPRAIGLPAWFRARMSRREERTAASTSDAHVRSLEPPRDLREVSNAAGTFAVRETCFAMTHRHGAVELEEVARIDPARFVELTGDESLRELDPRTAVYLDIETTGLSGGAGTKAFLVALGRFTVEHFELWQGFLRSPEEQRALLQECVERIAAASVVISFFGKAFDRHRLEDAMRMHKLAPPFASRPHLDLYYPCRKLHRAHLPNCKLATLERAVCGVERDHDLPGSFAPEAWFDFIAGRPHLLEDVFRHNADDVLSLVTLCARVGSPPT